MFAELLDRPILKGMEEAPSREEKESINKTNINNILEVKQKKIKIYGIPKNIRKNNINKQFDYFKDINFTISFKE